jgi:exodeoxyribonuclease V beta subunit
MSHSHYYLQYLLYCVALHRYLEQRITDYSWETHIGGVYYLFVRGMKPAPQQQESPKTGNKWGGVFFHKPSLELIQALDGLFMRLTPAEVANG